MNRKFIIYGFVTVVSFGIGLFGSVFFLRSLDDGNAALVGSGDHLRQLFELSASEIENSDCYPPKDNNQPYRVSDFLVSYLDFFSSPSKKKTSHIEACDIREKNMCGITYSEQNVEGDMGVSWTLWYKINPQTGKIDPNHFECWGL